MRVPELRALACWLVAINLVGFTFTRYIPGWKVFELVSFCTIVLPPVAATTDFVSEKWLEKGKRILAFFCLTWLVLIAKFEFMHGGQIVELYIGLPTILWALIEYRHFTDRKFNWVRIPATSDNWIGYALFFYLIPFSVPSLIAAHSYILGFPFSLPSCGFWLTATLFVIGIHCNGLLITRPGEQREKAE